MCSKYNLLQRREGSYACFRKNGEIPGSYERRCKMTTTKRLLAIIVAAAMYMALNTGIPSAANADACYKQVWEPCTATIQQCSDFCDNRPGCRHMGPIVIASYSKPVCKQVASGEQGRRGCGIDEYDWACLHYSDCDWSTASPFCSGTLRLCVPGVDWIDFDPGQVPTGAECAG